MVTVYTSGPMAVNLKEIGKKIKLLDTVSITGKMEESMKVIGNRIICMDKVSTSGQMEDSTKEIMLTTKRSHMVFTHILMAAVTKETGKLVNSMERVSSLARKVFKEKENGRMVKDSIGLMRWKEDTISVDLVLEVIDLFTILT